MKLKLTAAFAANTSIGVIGGGIIAGPGGAAGGLSAGSNFGGLVEEGVDLMTGQKTDLQLRQNLKDKKDILKIINNEIEQKLKPTITKLQNLVKQKEKAFRLCQNKERRG